MNKLSYSQQQLLKTLQITPLKANVSYYKEQPLLGVDNSLSISNIARHEAINNDVIFFDKLVPDASLALAQDILCLIPSRLKWFIQTDLLAPVLNANELLTPSLEYFQNTLHKKALWQLLQNLDEI